MAVFAPIPSASVRTAVSPNPQLFRKVRKANRTSCSKDSTRECSVCASPLAPGPFAPPLAFHFSLLPLSCELVASTLALLVCDAVCFPFVPSAGRASARWFAAAASGGVALEFALWRRSVFEPVFEGWSCRAMRVLPQVQERDAAYYLTLLNVLVSPVGLVCSFWLWGGFRWALHSR